ncbi:MAG: FecR family protein [Steroidobacteraceae bacterium]
MSVHIYEEASDWVIRHRDGRMSREEKRAFDQWLRQSPQNVSAYLEMSSIWEELPALDRSWNPGAEELIAHARDTENVVPLTALRSASGSGSSGAPTENVSARRSPRRKGLLYALAASILIVCGTASWLYSQRGIYRTDIGEQRSLTLADGSRVELNARSRIKVRYTEGERHIDLLEGQALFHVAKNKQRPFIVRTGDTQVRAVGTSFDVYRAKTRTVVTVIEGRVAIQAKPLLADIAMAPFEDMAASFEENITGRAGSADPSGPRKAISEEISMIAGQQIVVTPEAVTAPRETNIGAAMAWTRRSLVFDAAPLVEVVEEFNRYNTRPLVIEDARLDDFHVSGVFSSVDSGLLIRFLRAQPELAVEETGSEIRIRKK